jgi:hypothetical protein
MGLALANLAMLVHARPALMPRFGFIGRALPPIVLAASCVLLPLPAVLEACLAIAVFVTGAYVTGALPAEVLQAIARRRVPS